MVPGPRTRRGAPRTPSGQLAPAGGGFWATAKAATRSRQAYTPYPLPYLFYIYNRVAECLALARLGGPRDLEKFEAALTFLLWTHCDQELPLFRAGVVWLGVFGASGLKTVLETKHAGARLFGATRRPVKTARLKAGDRCLYPCGFRDPGSYRVLWVRSALRSAGRRLQRCWSSAATSELDSSPGL